MPPPLPPKLSSLAEKLQADQQAIQHQLADQTQQLLKLHNESLRKLSGGALRSMRSALEAHAAELDGMQRATAARTRWLLLWPVLMSMLVSVLMVVTVTAWATYRLDQVNDAQAVLDQSSVNLAAQQQAQQARQHQVQHVPPLRKRR